MSGSPSDRIAAERILAHYRRLVLLGKVLLPLEAARRLVGPDCAYHLYFRTLRSLASAQTRRRRGKPRVPLSKSRR